MCQISCDSLVFPEIFTPANATALDETEACWTGAPVATQGVLTLVTAHGRTPATLVYVCSTYNVCTLNVQCAYTQLSV